MSNHEIRQQLMKQLEKTMDVYNSEMNFIIETKQGETIGFVRFLNINWKSRNLSLTIYLGDKKHQNLLYGADSLFTTLSIAFNELNMHKIIGNIFEFNKRSIRIAERGGAKREAVLRKHVFKSGKYYDVYVYGVLRSDFEQLVNEFKDTILRRES